MDDSTNQNATLQDLIHYIKHGADDQVKKVLENQPNLKTQKNMPVLAKAAVGVGSKNIIVNLLEHGLNVNAALDIVVSSGKDDLINLMIDRGADVNEGLYFAVKANKKNAITLLLELGANINTNQRNGNTPLHTGLMQKICDFELIEFLIKRGADTRVQTRNNKSALDLFQKIRDGKHDEENKKRIENIAILINDNQNNNMFECIMGLSDGLSGYSYQAKIFTLYAILNTKQECQYKLSTEVKKLIPFDDIYLIKVQDGQTTCEFIQVKQTKKPEFNKINSSKFFTMLKSASNLKDHIKGNDSIMKIFLKFNDIHENFLDTNTSGVFIHCETTTFQDDPSPFLTRIDADINNSVLCGIKHDKWIINKNSLYIEIKYVLLNLIKISPYFSIMDEDMKTMLINEIHILENATTQNRGYNLSDDSLSSTKTIALIGLNTIKKYLTYLDYCKKEIEKAIDVESVKKNMPEKYELLYTNDLPLLINRAVSRINEIAKSFAIDTNLFTYFSKFDDVVIREQIERFIKQFSIYTNCPTSDELDHIMTKEISEAFAFDIPILISTYCQQYFSRWISNFKNERGSVFTDRDGKKLFYDIRMDIFHAFNKSYIEELQRTELKYRQNNEQVISFLKKDNNYNILHVVTQNTRLHAINIFQTIKNIKDQSSNLDHLNNMIFTSFEHMLKSNANLKNLFDVYNSQDSNDSLILECLEDNEQQNVSLILDYLKNITTATTRKKLIIIANSKNQLTTILKTIIKENTSYNHILTFKDLTYESQQCILNKTVKFINNPNSLITHLKLKDFITLSAACEDIDECLLSTIVTDIEDIEIGNDNVFILGEYNTETFIPRYFRNMVDVGILQKYTRNLFFVTGITKNELIAKVLLNTQSIYVWEKDKVYKKGIVLMPHSNTETRVNIFKNLLDKNAFCYWLEFKGELLYFINREDISEEYANLTEQTFTQHKMVLENIEEKVVIVANDAGEGKSTMLTHLAYCLRKKSNNFWIIRIDLRNYAVKNLTVSLNDITFDLSDTTKAVEFITHMVIEVKSAKNRLERKLLEGAMNGQGTLEVILLFDGFDEISPSFKEKTCNLLKTLRKSHIKQFWVTTRVHLKEYLEKELGVPACSLAGFKKAEQMQFLKQFWKWQLNNCSNELTEEERAVEIAYRLRLLFNNLRSTVSIMHFDNQLKKLLQKKPSFVDVQEVINNEKVYTSLANALLKLWENSQKNHDFFKIPLHLEMIATNLIQRQWKHFIFRNSLLYGLYTEFVESKLEIYNNRLTNRTGNQYANDQADMIKVLLRKMHHEIAVTTLYSTLQEVLPDVNICREYPNFLEKLIRVGLVKCYGSRVEFVHRTFAEFFFSEYVVTHLDYPEIQTEFLEKIFFNNDYQLVRTFFDEFLFQYERGITGCANIFDNILIPTVSERIIKHINNNNENILHIAVRSGHLQIFLLILNNISKRTLIKLITKNSPEGLSMLELSIFTGHTAISNTIVNTLKELMVYSQFAIFVQVPIKIINTYAIQVLTTALTGISQGNLRNSASVNINMNSIRRPLLADLVFKFNNEHRRTVLHLAVVKEQNSVFKSIINAAKSCSILEKIIMFVDLDKRSILHEAIIRRNEELILYVIENINDNLELLKQMITLTDKDGLNVLHMAARFGRNDAFYIILKSIERCEGITKHLITQRSSSDDTVLSKAAFFGSINICKVILETAEKHDFLKELITKSNTNQNMILHSAVWGWESVEICTVIFNYLKYHEDLIKYLITQQDDSGQSVLHIAVYLKKAEVIDTILKTAKKYKDNLKTILMLCDNQKLTVLQQAAKLQDHVICLIILNYAVDDVDVFKDVIMQCDLERGWTALHLAAVHGYSKICCVILNIAKIHKKVLKKVLMQCDKYGYTALELAEHKTNVEILNYINKNTYTASELIQHKNGKDFGDVLISNILQSHCAQGIWMFKIKSKVKVIHSHTHVRNKRSKDLLNRRSELTDLYIKIFKIQSRIYDYVSKVKDYNKNFNTQHPKWYNFVKIEGW